MAGPSLPAAGHITNDLRTEAEVKSDLDDLIEVVRRTPGASPPEDLTISAGVVTPTGAGSILIIETEGAVAADDLDTIAITNMVDGAEITIANTSGNTVTVIHEAGGSGEISLQGDVDTDLDPGVSIELYLDGTIWREKGRAWGDDPSALRAYQGLGTAALADEGPGNGLDADTLDGQHAAAFLGVAGTAANSSLLGGLAASGFVQTATGSLQTIQSILRSTGGRFEANAASAGLSAGFNSRIAGVLRVAEVFDDITDRWQIEIYAPDGTTPVARLRIDADDGIFQYDPTGGGTFYNVDHAGPGGQTFDPHLSVATVTADDVMDLGDVGTQVPITDLAGLAFPSDPDGTKTFAVTTCVASFVGVDGSRTFDMRFRIHVGTAGDETDTAVYVGELFDNVPSGSAVNRRHDLGTIIVQPAANELVTVTWALLLNSGVGSWTERTIREHRSVHDSDNNPFESFVRIERIT